VYQSGYEKRTVKPRRSFLCFGTDLYFGDGVNAGEDIYCPTGGGVGFSVTLPPGFVASDQATANNSALVKSLAMCFPKDANWNVMPMAAPSGLLGTCVNARMNKTGDFCRSAPAMVRFPAPQRQ
jgi:hypothetical protein